MADYQSYAPVAIGPSFAPLHETVVTLDTGSEIGYTFIAQDALNVSLARVVSKIPPAGVPTRAEMGAYLYSGRPCDTIGRVKKVSVDVSDGAGGTLSGGAGSYYDALTNPSDGKYVRLSGASATAYFSFYVDYAPILSALSGVVPSQIIDISVIYSVSGPFATAAANTMECGMKRLRTTYAIEWPMDTTVTGPALTSSTTELRRSSWGDLNPMWHGTFVPSTSNHRMPWVYESLDGAGLADFVGVTAAGNRYHNVYFKTGAGASGNFDIHHVTLEVTYRVNDGIIAAGGMMFSLGCEYPEGLFAYTLPLAAYTNISVGSVFETVTLTPGNEYTLVVGRAYSGPISVATPASFPITMLDSLSTPSLCSVEGISVTKPLTNGTIAECNDLTKLPAITLHDSCDLWDITDPDWSNASISSHPYITQRTFLVGNNLVQEILNDVTGTYKWVIFYARANGIPPRELRIGGGDAAGVPTPGGYATLSYTDLLTFPEIKDGWRRVILELPVGIVLNSGGGVVHLCWQSFSYGDNWEVLAASANNIYEDSPGSTGAVPTYGGETGYAVVPSLTSPDYYAVDLAAVLVQDMPIVSGLGVVQATQDLVVVDECCDIAQSCIPTGIVYNVITWTLVTGDAVSGWNYMEVQRRDSTMLTGTWETIAKITTPFVSTMSDYEARIGVESRYRVRMVHVSEVAGDWSVEVASTIAAPGVAGSVSAGLLCFTSNNDPTTNVAYVHVGGRGEEFTFVEADWVTVAPIYGRDYQIASRPSERGGVSFSRPLLINSCGVPTGTLAEGFATVRDAMWNANPYVCVRDELAHRWLATVKITAGIVRRAVYNATNYEQIAQANITEVTDTPAPINVERGFIGLESVDGEYTYCDAPDSAAFLTLADVEIRFKVITLDTAWNVTFAHNSAGAPNYADWSVSADQNKIRVYMDGSGGYFDEESASSGPWLQNKAIWVRGTYDHDVGAGNAQSTYGWSANGVAWTSLGSDTDVARSLVLVDDGTMSIYVTGAILQQIAVINSATSANVVTIDFTTLTESTVTFLDGQGNTWTIHRGE